MPSGAQHYASYVDHFTPSGVSRHHHGAQVPAVGFTLVEILIALALITLLAVGITLAFDGSRSRADALFSNMVELGAGNIRLKNDIGCYVLTPAGLITSSAASTASCAGGVAPTNWNGPYVGQFASDGSGNVLLNKVAQGVTLKFNSGNDPGTGPFGATGTNYWVEASGVPKDVVKQALQECNGDTNLDGTLAAFAQVKCNGDSATGIFQVLYDQTRVTRSTPSVQYHTRRLVSN